MGMDRQYGPPEDTIQSTFWAGSPGVDEHWSLVPEPVASIAFVIAKALLLPSCLRSTEPNAE